MEITIGKGIVSDTKLTEIATGEEYVLYKTDAADDGCGKNTIPFDKLTQFFTEYLK